MDVNMIIEGLKESLQIDEFDRLRTRDIVRIDLETAKPGELMQRIRQAWGRIDDEICAMGACLERIREIETGERQAA